MFGDLSTVFGQSRGWKNFKKYDTWTENMLFLEKTDKHAQ